MSRILQAQKARSTQPGTFQGVAALQKPSGPIQPSRQLLTNISIPHVLGGFPKKYREMKNGRYVCPFGACRKKRRVVDFGIQAGTYKVHMLKYHGEAIAAEQAVEAAELNRKVQNNILGESAETRELYYFGARAATEYETERVIIDHSIDMEAELDEMSNLQAQAREALRAQIDEESTAFPPHNVTRNVNVEVVQPEENREILSDGEQHQKFLERREWFKPVHTDYHRRATIHTRKLADGELVFQMRGNPFFPFETSHDFKVGSWLVKGFAGEDMIATGYNGGILNPEGSIKKTTIRSKYTLDKRVEGLDPTFGKNTWSSDHVKFIGNRKSSKVKFFYRNIVEAIQHFFKQPAYRDHLVYTPYKQYNKFQERIYSEMFSADWVHRKQDEIDKLRLGSFVIPVIFASDVTHLSDGTGNAKFWPLYMSIGNLHSAVRNKPSNNAWILIGQIPIPPRLRTFDKKVDGPVKSDWKKEIIKAKDDAFAAAITAILKPMKDVMLTGLEIPCADGEARWGFPEIAAWIADYQEYNKIYNTKQFGCCMCEVNLSQLGDQSRSPERDYNEYNKRIGTLHWLQDERAKLQGVRGPEAAEKRQLYDEQIKSTEHYFNLREMKAVKSALLKSGCAGNMLNVWKPDILHTIYEGVFGDHILKLLKQFLNKHELLAEFERVWLDLPATDGIPAPTESIFHDTQTTGKAKRNALKRILAVLLVVLGNPTSEQFCDFHDCISTVRYLVDFSLLCTYRYHTEETLNEMDVFLEWIHFHKGVFNEFRTKPYSERTTGGTTIKPSKDDANHAKIVNDEDELDYDDLEDAGIDASSAKASRTPLTKSVRTDTRNKINKVVAEPQKVALLSKPSKKKTKATNKTSRELTEEKVRKRYSNRTKLMKEYHHLVKMRGPNAAKQWIVQKQAEDPHQDMYGRDFDPEAIYALIDKMAEEASVRTLDKGAYWKIVKLHLLSHFSTSVKEFGYMQQYSTEIGETLHKGVKQAYRHSNRKNANLQILQIYTRRFVVRMREINLEQIARDGLWQTDIQEALSLYGTKFGKLMAAKLHREGKGTLDDYYRNLEENQARREAEFEDVDDPDMDFTQEVWHLPPPCPLFAEKSTLREGISYSSPYVIKGVHRLGQIAEHFGDGGLPNAMRSHLSKRLLRVSGFSEGKVRSIMTDEVVRNMLAERWSTAVITRESYQMENPIRAFKLVSTGMLKGPYQDLPRNDAVIFKLSVDQAPFEERDRNSEDTAANRTHFGWNKVGILKAFIKLRIPKDNADWEVFSTHSSYFSEDQLIDYYVAYINPLRTLQFNADGELRSGSTLAVCEALPFQYQDGGICIDVTDIQRSAHLLKVSSQLETWAGRELYVLNNRIDLEIWEMFRLRPSNTLREIGPRRSMRIRRREDCRDE